MINGVLVSRIADISKIIRYKKIIFHEYISTIFGISVFAKILFDWYLLIIKRKKKFWNELKF